MKIRNIFHFLLPLSLLAFLTACDDVIDLELPDAEPRLVVDATITDLDTVQSVKLSYSANYFSNVSTPPATGALVVITDDAGVADTLVEEGVAGLYLSANRKQAGRTYTLYVQTTDGKTFTSDPELLRPAVPIEGIEYKYNPTGEFDSDSLPAGGYDILIFTTEPAGAGDFYRWRSYINGVELTDAEDMQFANDDFVDGNGTTTGFLINADLVPKGGHYRVEQMTISEGMYNFMFILNQQTAFVGGPFDSPPAPIPSNVRCVSHPDEKVYGYFSCAGVSVAEITVPE
jgi:hypothetical protein